MLCAPNKDVIFNFYVVLRLNENIENHTFLQGMILFYSEYCPHCRMLLDTIKRHDSHGIVKLACIEVLKSKGQTIPKQIHSVPALLLMPSKEMLYGKTVFDYLLLPGSGKLLVSVSNAKNTPVSQSHPQKLESGNEDTGPLAYTMSSSSGLSDAFAMIEDDVHPMSGLADRSYTWTSLNDSQPDNTTVFSNAPMQEETRSKKQLPDLDALRAQRDMELNQSDINTSQLIPPSFTR